MIDDDGMGPPPRIEPTESPGTPDEGRGLWSELWRRRVPYFVGGFIAATAGVVQFVDWVAGRYALSPLNAAARGPLERALDVWSEADAAYVPAQEARDLLAALERG